MLKKLFVEDTQQQLLVADAKLGQAIKVSWKYSFKFWERGRKKNHVVTSSCVLVDRYKTENRSLFFFFGKDCAVDDAISVQLLSDGRLLDQMNAVL